MTSLQQFFLSIVDLRHLAQLISGSKLIIRYDGKLRILVYVFLPLFTIASTCSTFGHRTILEISVLMHLWDIPLVLWIEIEIIVFNLAMFQGFNQTSVIQWIGLWTASLICLLWIKVFRSRYFFFLLFRWLRLGLRVGMRMIFALFWSRKTEEQLFFFFDSNRFLSFLQFRIKFPFALVIFILFSWLWLLLTIILTLLSWGLLEA
jgi:hypothetical protein